MWGVRSLRRTSREIVQRSLALPPGFRKVFADQKIDNSSHRMRSDHVGLNQPIQVNDPASSDFGDILFMVGYDDL